MSSTRSAKAAANAALVATGKRAVVPTLNKKESAALLDATSDESSLASFKTPDSIPDGLQAPRRDSAQVESLLRQLQAANEATRVAEEATNAAVEAKNAAVDKATKLEEQLKRKSERSSPRMSEAKLRAPSPSDLRPETRGAPLAMVVETVVLATPMRVMADALLAGSSPSVRSAASVPSAVIAQPFIVSEVGTVTMPTILTADTEKTPTLIPSVQRLMASATLPSVDSTTRDVLEVDARDIEDWSAPPTFSLHDFPKLTRMPPPPQPTTPPPGHFALVTTQTTLPRAMPATPVTVTPCQPSCHVGDVGGARCAVLTFTSCIV